MSQQHTVALGLVVAVSVSLGCVAGYAILQMQVSQSRIIATLDRRDTGVMVAQQPTADEPQPADEGEPQQGSIDMGPFTWSHFLTVSIFVLGIGATALGWLLGQKQDKAACEKRHGVEGRVLERMETNQTWIIDALRRIAENGGPGQTKLPDPPSHPDAGREMD